MKKLLVTILSFFALSAYAWEPSKPIQVSIGFAPGSGNELSFRGISSIVEKNNSKVNFVIENRPGADGVVAMNDFIKKPNDGHHIYIPSHQGIWVTAEYFQKDAVKYSLNDFEYVLTIAKSPLALIAYTGSEVSTVPEFLNKLQTTQKPITIAAGSGAHRLAFTYLTTKVSINTDLVKTVSYKGPNQAGQDVAGGHVEFGIIPVAVASSFARAGKIKILSILSEMPIKGVDAPLMNKWVPGMNVYAAWGIILPKNTSTEIINWYTDTFSKAIRSNEAKIFFENNFMFIDEKELTPSGFRKGMENLRAQWIPVIKTFKLD